MDHNRLVLDSVTHKTKESAHCCVWCRQTAHMRIAAALLESYERQVQSVEGALKVGDFLILLSILPMLRV